MWQLKIAGIGRKDTLNKLLANDWEPFGGYGDRIYLRKAPDVDKQPVEITLSSKSTEFLRKLNDKLINKLGEVLAPTELVTELQKQQINSFDPQILADILNQFSTNLTQLFNDFLDNMTPPTYSLEGGHRDLSPEAVTKGLIEGGTLETAAGDERPAYFGDRVRADRPTLSPADVTDENSIERIERERSAMEEADRLERSNIENQKQGLGDTPSGDGFRVVDEVPETMVEETNLQVAEVNRIKRMHNGQVTTMPSAGNIVILAGKTRYTVKPTGEVETETTKANTGLV